MHQYRLKLTLNDHPTSYIHVLYQESSQLHKQTQIHTFVIQNHLIMIKLKPITSNISKHNKNCILAII